MEEEQVGGQQSSGGDINKIYVKHFVESSNPTTFWMRIGFWTVKYLILFLEPLN